MEMATSECLLHDDPRHPPHGQKMSPEPKQPPKMLLTAARPPGMYDKQYHASAHDWTTRKTIVSPKLL